MEPWLKVLHDLSSVSLLFELSAVQEHRTIWPAHYSLGSTCDLTSALLVCPSSLLTTLL